MNITSPARWWTDPWDATKLRYWDGNQWTGYTSPACYEMNGVWPTGGSARHSSAYWLMIGWWWGPIKWATRVALWLGCWPIGLWRSIRHANR